MDDKTYPIPWCYLLGINRWHADPNHNAIEPPDAININRQQLILCGWSALSKNECFGAREKYDNSKFLGVKANDIKVCWKLINSNFLSYTKHRNTKRINASNLFVEACSESQSTNVKWEVSIGTLTVSPTTDCITNEPVTKVWRTSKNAPMDVSEFSVSNCRYFYNKYFFFSHIRILVFISR